MSSQRGPRGPSEQPEEFVNLGEGVCQLKREFVKLGEGAYRKQFRRRIIILNWIYSVPEPDRVWGFEFEVLGLGFRVWSLGSGFWGFGFWVLGLEF